MPIFLPAPQNYRAGGPDGQGWNRLSLNAHMGAATARCALRPRSYSTLIESFDTRRAQWGGALAACTGAGRCLACPVSSRSEPTVPWEGDAGRVLVRQQPRHVPGPVTTPGGIPDRLWAMQDANAGWDSRSIELFWDDMPALTSWRVGRAHCDEHGQGFWLHRAAEAAVDAEEASRP